MTALSVVGRLGLWWSELSFGTDHPLRRVFGLAALGTLAGIGETATVLMVVSLAASGKDGRVVFGVDIPSNSGTLAALAIGVLVGLAAVYIASARLTARVGSDSLRAVRTGLVDGYLRASWPAQSAVHGGELSELVMTNAGQVAFGTQQAALAISALLNLAVLVCAAVALSWWSAVGLAVIGMVTVAVMRPSRALVRQLASRSASSSATITRAVAETVAMARELRAFDATGAARARLEDAIRDNAADMEATQFVSRAVPNVTRAATIGLLVLALAVISGSGETSLPELGAIVILLLRALSQAQAVTSTVNMLSQRTANLVRVKRFLERWQSSAPTVGSRPCPAIDDITLEAVSYRYSRPPTAPGDLVGGAASRSRTDGEGTDERPALDGIDLRICRGEQIGLVGRTGAGKTTLAGILLGMLEPTSGRVLVNGVPLGDIRPAEWHRRVGWVPQDPRLLTGTVADNIRFFRDSLDDRDIERAAQLAGLGPERAAWPDGLNRTVGPGGVALSGGERQRVTLARALAGAPDLIILDEPTSAVDVHSETAIRASLAQLRGKVTIVVIAHRESTLDGCDRVVLLDGGRIVATGTPSAMPVVDLRHQGGQAPAAQPPDLDAGR